MVSSNASSSSGGRTVRVELGPRSYEIRIQAGLLAHAGRRLADAVSGRRVLVVSDRNVGPLFGPPLAKALQESGFDGEIVNLPPGEGAKSWEVAKSLYDLCFEYRLDRSSCLLALGGGVIGDLTGFVAATFMRGVDFVQVPTTLLAMVDASVGGKTALDHPKAKNGIGAFHQPRAVLIDPRTLSKLPEREFKAGLAEVIKYGVIADAEFFSDLEANIGKLLERDPEAVARAIERSCAIKARVVGDDERESEGGRRAILNFGHTFGHAIEVCGGYRGYLHGEAVAIGMLLAAELSVRRGLLDRKESARIAALLRKAGLPTRLKPADPGAESLHQATFRDKKVRAGKLRFVLAPAIGQAALFSDVPEAEARKIWDEAPRG